MERLQQNVGLDGLSLGPQESQGADTDPLRPVSSTDPFPCHLHSPSSPLPASSAAAAAMETQLAMDSKSKRLNVIVKKRYEHDSGVQLKVRGVLDTQEATGKFQVGRLSVKSF